MSDLLNRLLAERQAAHQRYNEALTELDRAIQSVPDIPSPPAAYDETLLPKINETWSILADGPPHPTGWGDRTFDMVWKGIAPLFERQMAFNAALVDHLNRNVASHRDTTRALERALPAFHDAFAALARFESLLIQFLQTITPLADTHYREINDALSQLRSVTDVAQRTAMIAKREVERTGAGGAIGAEGARGATAGALPAPLGALAPFAPPAPIAPSAYVGFEDRFRGSEETIRARLKEYVPYFEGQSNVLDIGCGRGEFLELLRDAGVSGKGLDLNPEMVEVCRSRGLDAAAGDACGYLQTLADDSLGGIIAVQVIEHLEPGYLASLLSLAFEKVRPGGRVVLETINPTCWVAFFESFVRDLSHVKPIHPETIQYLLQANGFSTVEIVYRSPIAADGRLRKVSPRPEHYGDTAPDQLTELVSAFNSNVDRLNDRMFSYQDFAAIATKP